MRCPAGCGGSRRESLSEFAGTSLTPVERQRARFDCDGVSCVGEPLEKAASGIPAVRQAKSRKCKSDPSHGTLPVLLTTQTSTNGRSLSLGILLGPIS
jgi:hypothetical protein